MRKLNTKLALAPAAVAAALMGSAAVAQDSVTLNVWSDTPRLVMFEDYDAKHDGVELEITTVAPADLLAKIQLALRSGTEVPDIVFMSSIDYMAQLTTRRSNYLLDLTDMISTDLQDEYFPNANSPCTLNGKLVCLRNDIAHMHVWYDKPLMEELGEAVPATWEEFEALGERLSSQGMSLGSGVEPFPVINMLASSGCDLATPVAGKDDTLHIDATSELCVKAAGMIDRMLANGALSNVGPFDPAFVSLYKEGKVPLLVGPTWFGEYVIKPTYEAAAGTIAAAQPLRWEDQDQPLAWSWGGGTYGGWKDTAHPEEVADVIRWMATDIANQTNAVTLPAHAPSADAWGKALIADTYYADDQVFAVEVQAADYSDPRYVSLRFEVPAAIAKTLVASATSGSTMVDALPALQQELVNQANLNGYSVE